MGAPDVTTASLASHRLDPLRSLLLAILAVSSLGPLVLLGVWSVSGAWFFPALLPETFTLSAWRTSGTGLMSALATSTVLAAATAILACIVGLPAGRALASLHGWRRHLAAAAAFLPVAAPPLALGTGLQVVALRTGIAGSFTGVLVAHLIPAAGYLTLIFLGTFTLWDVRAEEAAQTLGGSSARKASKTAMSFLRFGGS